MWDGVPRIAAGLDHWTVLRFPYASFIAVALGSLLVRVERRLLAAGLFVVALAIIVILHGKQ